MTTTAGEQPLPLTGFEGTDADSSPRWRACAAGDPCQADALPLTTRDAPERAGLVRLFDAGRIGTDLEDGAARAVLSVSGIRPDVDRVLAIYPDGRVYGWHQYNDKTRERDWDVTPTAQAGDLVEVPTTYDGEDLDDVARRGT